MSDRELLELAAKAAGIIVKHLSIKPATAANGDGYIGLMTDPDEWPRGWFDPLTDDGDAQRLAVALGLEVYHSINDDCWTAFVGYPKQQRIVYVMEPWGAKPYAATRRAIVRAAAEIGKEMK